MLKQKETASAQVLEFRTRAQKLRDEIIDPAVEMTSDELKKKTEAINSLEARAAAAAGFTANREIAAQGGDVTAGLHRVDGPETRAGAGGEEGEGEDEFRQYEVEHVDVNDILKNLQARAGKYFGNIRNFVHAAANNRAMNPAQAKLMKDCEDMAKFMYPDDAKGSSMVIQGRTISGASATSAQVLLPLQQVPSIFSLPNVLMGVLQGAARYSVTGRTLRIPYVVQTNAHGGITRPTAGIANVNIITEGNTKDTREPQFLQRLLTVQKWAAIAQIGDETLGDDFTGQLAPQVTQQVGGQVLNSMNEYMTYLGNDATGAAMPLGAANWNNPALYKVNRQTHASVTITDVFKMYSRHTHGPKSMWLCSRRVIEKLFALTLAGTTLVAFLNNLQGTPAMSLLGYPIYICDILPSLGSQADFALINPEFYAAAVRTNLTVESSIHVAFTSDITTYRFLARGGGIPIPDGTYAYRSNGTGKKYDDHSPFVVLAPATSS